MLRSLTGAIHLLTLPNGREALLVWLGVLVSFWDQSLDSLENGRQLFRQGETQIPTNRQKDDFRFELPPLEQTGNR